MKTKKITDDRAIARADLAKTYLDAAGGDADLACELIRFDRELIEALSIGLLFQQATRHATEAR